MGRFFYCRMVFSYLKLAHEAVRLCVSDCGSRRAWLGGNGIRAGYPAATTYVEMANTRGKTLSRRAFERATPEQTCTDYTDPRKLRVDQPLLPPSEIPTCAQWLHDHWSYTPSHLLVPQHLESEYALATPKPWKYDDFFKTLS